MLHTSFLAELFKLKSKFLIGPESRNEGGVCDAMITKDSNPFVHVEYKSNNGSNSPLMFAQAKKYIYKHTNLAVDGLFGIYPKGQAVSFFITNDHGHSDNGYLLKGPMYNGMFGLYVDLQENLIKILPQENTYFPQYIPYDMSDNEGYLRAECIMTFMSLHESPPSVEFNKETNRFEFIPETVKDGPVQVFRKGNDEYSVSCVNTKGEIFVKDGLDTTTVLHFHHRPNSIPNDKFFNS